ncbi:A disintegrin and metalloproteinase with thrombospondin motifs 16 [Trichinella papuae]|uniref:A disintegrin and metalloproteinase with thrombospondin motifs 16 n=1 Tax=Trichinella papuae TaxID=268474 RepID=A0A0V1MX75_9BILA|nr:A disintegrin and metalloproteinase with thrombospondin motifs 16 [Trichinella papuae]
MTFRRDHGLFVMLIGILIFGFLLKIALLITSRRYNPLDEHDDPERLSAYENIQNLKIDRSKNIYNEKLHVSFEAFKQHFMLVLTSVDPLVSKEANFFIQNGPKRSSILPRHCHFHGHAISHGNKSVALSICNSIRGILILDDHFLVIQPLLDHGSKTLAENPSSHVIYKRSASLNGFQQNELLQHIEDVSFNVVQPEQFCEVTPPPLEQMPLLVQNDFAGRTLPDTLKLELALFLDDRLWRRFEKLHKHHAESELQDYALSLINNVNLLYRQPTIRPKLNIVVVHLEMWKTEPENLNARLHKYGEAQFFLDQFCQLQGRLRKAGANWDHATLLTGYDIYHTSTSVAGVAPVARMCDTQFSCSLIEGNHLGRSFVLAHEMGHNLGMLHDGVQNQCSQSCCLMSPVNGAGRTNWSPCSVREYQSFLVDIMKPESTIPNCLSNTDGVLPAPILGSTIAELPGQRYTADQQCEFFWGDGYLNEIPDGKSREDICHVLWCSNGGATISSAHPALEGTWCGNKNWCRNGKCVPWSKDEAPEPVDGQWTEWSRVQHSRCSDCVIANAVRLRSEVRQCKAPAPNNGGRDCLGSSIRGLLCQGTAACDQFSKADFSDRICAAIRNDPEKPDPDLSGKGFQHPSSPCKVWCHLRSTLLIRSKGKYPDGTPCATVIPIEGAWSPWSPWSNCSASCGIGTQIRKRQCENGKCLNGTSIEEQICNGVDCSSWTSWSEWSKCSASCGNGARLRSRTCRTDQPCEGPSVDFENCIGTNCSSWSEWSAWSTCSRSCGVGKQSRNRQCKYDLSTECDGHSEELKTCNDQDCPVLQGSWSEWSKCTEQCANSAGTRTRSRACSPDHHASCIDSKETQTEPCLGKEDCPIWLSWGPWSACTVSCGSGIQTRLRTCLQQETALVLLDGTALSNRCPGSNMESRSCATEPCEENIQNEDPASWTEWTTCSATCGLGVKIRRRNCKQSMKLSFKHICKFTSDQSECHHGVQKITCELKPCQHLDAEMEWQPWSPCSKSCGTGYRHRMRSCESCSGNEMIQQEPCNTFNCSVTLTTELTSLDQPSWSEWSPWSECSKTCDGGRQVRRRHCSTTLQQCKGFAVEETICNEQSCDQNQSQQKAISKAMYNNAQWSNWSEWSECSCYKNLKIRLRHCIVSDPKTMGFCLGPSYEKLTCIPEKCKPTDGGWTEWSSWSHCSQTCSGSDAVQTRFRACANPVPSNQGFYCQGSATDVQQCPDLPDCSNGTVNVDIQMSVIFTLSFFILIADQTEGTWTDWSTWTDYHRSIGCERKRARTRCQPEMLSCTTFKRYCSGGKCVGEDFQQQTHANSSCSESAKSASWTPWSEWSKCASTCDQSTQTRQRSCKVDDTTIVHGSLNSIPLTAACIGEAWETAVCKQASCANEPLDGQWSTWSEWSSCSSRCSAGSQSRRRSCDSPRPMNGGTDCLGTARQVKSCQPIDHHHCTTSVQHSETMEVDAKNWENSFENQHLTLL